MCLITEEIHVEKRRLKQELANVMKERWQQWTDWYTNG